MTKKQAGAKFSTDVQPVFEMISKLVDGFCKDHLNEEYAVLCQKLTEKRTSECLG